MDPEKAQIIRQATFLLVLHALVSKVGMDAQAVSVVKQAQLIAQEAGTVLEKL